MNLLVSASIIGAFFAGVAALFAPCCVTVLLPTYLASIFKQRTTVFLMTFVFFLGLLTVFMPIGLGVTAVSQLIGSYHIYVYLAGASLLLFLGFTLVLGQSFALPIHVYPQLKKASVPSVYMLGIFSGIATTCCAPVLAGVLTLAAMPGSMWLGAAYTLAYVLGMVVPLFVLAATLDKAQFSQRFFGFRKKVTYSFLGHRISLPLSNLLSGVMYLVLGGLIAYLALTNSLESHSSYQVSINIYLTKIIQFIGSYTSALPEYVWAVIFFGCFVALAAVALRQLRGLKAATPEKEACCE